MAEHQHPVESESKIKIEDVVTATEYGGEGCEEHYNERTIVYDPNYAIAAGRLGVTSIGKAIVLGEALATPRCKRRPR